MPGRRVRRHFSQLSELERDLIIGMKTAGWSIPRVADKVDHSECASENVGSFGYEEGHTCGDQCLEQSDHEERLSKDRAAITRGPHRDSFHDKSRRRGGSCYKNNF